jgi:hypothetical protein
MKTTFARVFHKLGVDGIEPSLSISKTDALPLGDTPTTIFTVVITTVK